MEKQLIGFFVNHNGVYRRCWYIITIIVKWAYISVLENSIPVARFIEEATIIR